MPLGEEGVARPLQQILKGKFFRLQTRLEIANDDMDDAPG